MASVEEMLATALRCHRSGELRQAAQLYEQILAANPQHADTWHLLGVAAHQAGDQLTAIRSISRAIAIGGGNASFYNSLGLAQRAAGRSAEARASYERALQLARDFEPAHYNLGLVLETDGDLQAALCHFEEAVSLRPDHAEAYNGIGNVYRAQGRPADAIASYQAALALQPNLAEALNNLGTTLVQLKHVDQGLDLLRRSVVLRPEAAETHANLGYAWKRSGRPAEAVASFSEALRLRADFIDARLALGVLLQECGQLDDAAACFREVLRCRPDGPEPRHTLGEIYQQQGRMTDAEACYQQVVAAHGDFDAAHYHLGLLQLSQGRFADGWNECQWRWRTKEQPRSFPQAEWDGSPLAGRTILVHPEQGLGDTLQFVRYVPLLEQMGARVIVEVHPPLVHLLRGSLTAEVIAFGSPLPAFDVHVPLLSVPRILGTRMETIPVNVPYLRVDPGLAEQWRRELSPIRGFRVGIHWQGNPEYAYDASRSIPLVEFAPLAGLPEVALVSLQRKDGLEQLPLARRQFTIHELGARVDEDRGAFVDSAAVIKNLDLVITSDTATAHLAGALGVPVWVALSRAPDWRWLWDREDNPWYPTMRVYRQTRWNEWSSVFARIARELRQEVSRRAPHASP
jgi:tetratricopeptide (TPR) repeat protein